MASAGSTQALIKKRQDELQRMPPPPVRHIKRPATVLDEDEYTQGLSEIIARDFFPGLLETKLQEEYLDALESENESWIQEAGSRLVQMGTSSPADRTRRDTRNTRFDTPRSYRNAVDTPRGVTGADTPMSAVETVSGQSDSGDKSIDTSTLSLSSYQAKYTSEDNESFNGLLDKQNAKLREKHTHLWTPDQRLLSNRQIDHRAAQDKLLKEKAEYESANGKALIPVSLGATSERPAKPDSWKIKKPDNTFMFNPSSVDEDGTPTIFKAKEAASKAGPRQVIHANTRFPPLHYIGAPGTIPSSPSLNTEIIARRDAARATRSETEYSGSETPRVNGYAYVDEDEPENIPHPGTTDEPSYRDLLAGQAVDGTPNPFKLSQIRRREDLHHRMVERDAAKKRTKERDTVKTAAGDMTPGAGNMTPAARRLMQKLGRSPVNPKQSRMSSQEMWTPGVTPRRKT